MTKDNLLTTIEAAEALNLKRPTILQHIHNGIIPAQKYGPIYLIKSEDVKAYAQNRRPSGRPPWIIKKIAEEKGIDNLDEFRSFVRIKAQREQERVGRKSRIRYTRDFVAQCADLYLNP